MGRVQSIQALRALAALMVVIFHSKIMFADAGTRETLFWIPGFTDFGDLGVSLFFVISGFIIATVLDKPTFSIGQYVWRRFMRIYPLLWIVMLAGLYHYYIRTWFAAEFNEHQSWTWFLSFAALPQEKYPFWNPAWTLEHEVLFYMIAAFTVRWIGLKGLSVLLFGLGLSGMIFDFGWNFHLTDNPQIYFAFGIAAYLCRDLPVPAALFVAFIGLGTTYAKLYGLVSFNNAIVHFTFPAGAAGAIVALLRSEQRGLVVPRALSILGDASYSLYLWHWLTLPIVGMFYGLFGGPPEAWRWLFVAASILVAIISLYVIERPVIAFSHRKWKQARKDRPLTVPGNRPVDGATAGQDQSTLRIRLS